MIPPKKYFGPSIGGVRGVGGTSNWHPYYSLIRRLGICKNIGGPRYIGHVVACFHLVSPLDIPIQYNKNNKPKGCPMVMADPLDPGHGKNHFITAYQFRGWAVALPWWGI